MFSDRPLPVRLLRTLLGLLLIAAGTLAARDVSADTPPPPPPPPLFPDGTPAPRERVQPPRVQPPRVQPPRRGTRQVPPPPPPPSMPGVRGPDRVPARQPGVVPPLRPLQPAAPAPANTLPGVADDPLLGAPVPSPGPPAVEPPRRQPGDPQPVITRIEFVGTVVYSPGSLKVLLRNKEGRRLDPVALDADTKTLFQYFKQVQIREQDVPGGIILRIRVAENPMVAQLVIRGAAELGEDEVRALIRTRVGYPLNPYHLREDAEDIVAAYRLRGFPFAHVPEPVIRTLPNGGRRVDLAIVEGPKVQVRQVVFRGNHSIPAKDLKEVMLSKEAEFPASLLGAGTFREEALHEDVIAIKELYRAEGFLDVEAALSRPRYSDDKSKIDVVIDIVEHEPYRVGSVTVDIRPYRADPRIGATPEDRAALTRSRIRAMLGVQPGERYSGKKFAEGVKRVRETYFKRSFLQMRISDPIPSPRQNENVVDVRFEISEGPKQRIGRVDFVGNEFTRDKILRRELRLSPGGHTDRTELERGEARLNRLGYFDRASLRLEPARNAAGEEIPGLQNATYEIVEGKTGNVGIGAGLSTDGGVFGSFSYTKRNFDITRFPTSFADLFSRRTFTGAGQELRLLLQPSTVASAFETTFREPRLFGSLWSLELSGYKRFQVFDDFLVDRTGYSVGLGYPVFEAEDGQAGLLASLRWRHDWVDIRDVEDENLPIPGALLYRDERELRGLAATLRYNATDDIRDPQWRFTATAESELVGGPLGGELDFWRVEGLIRYGRVLFENRDGDKYRLRSRWNVAYFETFEDTTPEVPPYERRFAGGNNFRGFRFRGMGPHINGDPTGGEWLATGSVEIEVPVVKNTLGLVAFSDFGTLGTNINAPDAFKWRVSIGVGLRLIVAPISAQPLAFDFAWPILYEDEDERSVVSFSLGRDF
jgi:outer membrane protein assembly complex protein YaeT